MKLQEELLKRKIKFETHKAIFGQPDIFIKPNICIFADGDYWHNTEKSKKRDKEVNKVLLNKGYKILRFWEHKINSDVKKCINKIEKSITRLKK